MVTGAKKYYQLRTNTCTKQRKVHRSRFLARLLAFGEAEKHPLPRKRQEHGDEIILFLEVRAQLGQRHAQHASPDLQETRSFGAS